MTNNTDQVRAHDELRSSTTRIPAMADNDVRLSAKTLLVSACIEGLYSFTADAIEAGFKPTIPFDVAVSALNAALASAPPSAPVGVSSEDRIVLMRLKDALPDVGLNGWIDGVRVIERILAQQPAPSVPVRADDALIAGAMEAAADACSRHVVCNEAIAAAVEYALSQQPAGVGGTATNSAVAAIQFALKDPEGMTFLRLWNEGEFDTLRREWPDAPVEVYINADPLAAQQQGGRADG